MRPNEIADIEYLEFADTKNTDVSKNCPATPSCDEKNPFRTPDGSCNNLKNPKFGMSGTPLKRILPNKYADGIHLLIFFL